MAQETYRVGELVTVLPPYDSDPYILNFQHYGRIADVAENRGAESQAIDNQAIDNQAATYYMVELDATLPPRRQVGPFPPSRLARGWRDQNGRWLVE